MKTTTLLGLGSLLVLIPFHAVAANWPQWRGPFFNGSTTDKNLPETWSKTKNVLWAAPLPGQGHATPAVWDDYVFVTSPDPDKNLLLICLDRKDGKVRWQKVVGVGDKVVGRNNMASPSPVTDGKTVWVMFGTGDIAAYDFAGNQLWARNLCKEYGRFAIMWLYGSSPLLYKDRLYIEDLQRLDGGGRYSGGGDGKTELQSFLLCLDPKTGKNIWKHDRVSDAVGESQESYTTPIPSELNGRSEIVVAGGDYVTGHDPKTGEELWRGGGLNNTQHRGDSRLVPSPVMADGMVFVNGPKRNPLLAYRDGGKGDITASGLAWTYAEYPTDCPTPLIYKGKLFVLDGDKQMMTCMDPKSGAVAWKQSLGTREIFRASPTGADGKIYCLSEDATAVVMSAVDGKILSTIKMDEGQTHATIVASHGCLFVRAAQHLYCIGKK